ncbi:MAG: hypothetical protein ABIR68_12585 [Ilumatobacteraceae bacterium]
MNVSLEDKLRRHYDERTRDIPEHGPGLDEGAMLTIGPPHTRNGRHPATRTALVIGAVAAATVLGFVVVDRPTSTRPGGGTGAPTAPVSSPTTDPVETLVPVATLPDNGDVSDTPVTVAGTAPSDWYRLQPDLDVAWYQPPSAQTPSMLCWRTPSGSHCKPDDSPVGALPLIVPTAGAQTLVVVVAAADTTRTLDVQLNSGTVLSAPVSVDDTIGWGVARYQVPDGDTITSVGTASAKPGDLIDVPGRTLPAMVGLDDVPVTISVGSTLSYWRWFPDLDISERETAEGGTELCWRTPVGTGCLDDSFISPHVGVIPTDGGAIILARPALIEITPPPTDPLAPKFRQGPPPTTITATLTDGSSITAKVSYGEQFGVGYARITLTTGIEITAATSS